MSKNKKRFKHLRFSEPLTCKHCFTVVDNQNLELANHLREYHNIIKDSDDLIINEFITQTEAKKYPRVYRIRKSIEARNDTNKKKLIQRQKPYTYNPNQTEKDFYCGAVINGQSFTQVISIPMGGKTKKY